MSAPPPSGPVTESVLAWAANNVGPGAQVVDVQPLHDWGPWWLRIDYDGSIRNAVLRLGDRHSPQLAANAAALRFAAENAVAAPRLLAADLHGETLDVAAILETALPGNSTLPPTVTPARLREAGAAIAKVHAIRLDPRPELPLRVRPTQVDDRAMERRGVSAPHTTPLLQLADERIREIDRPRGETVFVHGDVWGGNMRWEGDTCTALIDWFCAGAGDPGVDLGELRMQMGYQYGLHAADHVLDGWQREAGREATNVAYWDTVAALNTPVDMAGWPAFDDHGDPLEPQAVIDRRDAFLRSALDRLPG